MGRPPLYEHEEGQPGFEGVRRTRISSQALKAIENCEIGPSWAPANLKPQSRDALQRWGLAEFRIYGTYSPRKRESMPIILGRLTPEGVKVRDDYHRRRAEKLYAAEENKRKKKQKRKRRRKK